MGGEAGPASGPVGMALAAEGPTVGPCNLTSERVWDLWVGTGSDGGRGCTAPWTRDGSGLCLRAHLCWMGIWALFWANIQ